MRKKAFSRAILFLVIAAAMTGMFLAAKNAKAKESKQFDSEAAVQGYIAADKLDDVILKSSTSTITITYKPNGGSGSERKETVTKDANFKTWSGSTYSRDGYKLAGWALYGSASNASYTPGATAHFAMNVILYAVWKPAYKVTYDGNGGKNTPSAQIEFKGTSLTLTTATPYKEGYNFGGWKGSDGKTYAKGAKYTGDANITMKAIWNVITYQVKLNVNGGSSVSTPLTKQYAVALKLPSPTKTGYTFSGWKTSSGTVYSPGSSYTSNASAELTAVWTANKYTITYDGNGGTGATGPNVPSASQTFTYGSTVTINGSCYTKSGYTFVGWATSKTATSPYYTAGQTGVKFTGNITLYAVWKANEYVVVFDMNDGSNKEFTRQTKVHGTNLTLTSSKPTRTNYNFQGWATSATGSVVYGPSATYSNNAAVRLYAVWKPVEYTVSFNSNGGSGAPSAQKKIYGQTLTLSSTKPTRTYYTFLGWATSASATSATYSAGGSYTSNTAVTLYAVWKPNTYTITYNGNGGTGATGANVPSASQNYVYGNAVTINGSCYTKSGYTFVGWATSSSATTANYTAGQTGVKFSGDVTLYAVWKANVYTIYLDMNDGSGTNYKSLSKTHGVNLTLPTTKPTRTNYEFLGWATSSSATTATYTAGATYTGNATTRLYAVWKRIRYTITYDGNGGTGATGANVPSASQDYYAGNAVTINDSCYTKTGYTFTGWSTDKNATTATYTAGQTGVKFSGNVTLYAVWKTNVYTIILDMNDGSGTNYKSLSKTHGVNLTLPTTKPTRTNYEFLGWATSSSATTATYAAGATYTGNATTRLYAVWKRIRYTITYDGNGGTGATGANVPSASQDFYAGNAVTINDSCYTKTGCTFIGWSLEKNATTATYTAGQTGVKFTGNTTLYAVWKTTEYIVVFDMNDGSNQEFTRQTKVHGTSLTLTSSMPKRTNYTFEGWATSATGSVVYASGASYTNNVSVRLYAVWKLVEYNVTFNANGGSGAPATQKKIHGQTLTLSATEPKRTYYTFLGWATSSTATTATYSAGGSYTSNTAVTLYAVWKPNTYSISYNGNGGTGATGPNVPSASQTYVYGTSVTINGSCYTKTGCTFVGWSTDKNATTANYTAGQTGVKFSGDVILYAVWKTNEYTIFLDMNDGSGKDYKSLKKMHGTSITLPTTIPERTYYEFLGWATSSSATTATYAAGATYTGNSSARLYAVWKRIRYTITYDGNGGTGATGPNVPSASQEFYAGTTVTINDSCYTKTGRTFIGWSTNKNATSAAYTAGQSGVKFDGDITLYAVWKTNEYTIFFDMNDGSGKDYTSLKKLHGTSITLPETAPERTYYEFLGWATSSSATTATYAAGATYTGNSSARLYAVWKRIKYTIIYDGNGGTGATGPNVPSASQEFYAGTTVTINDSCYTKTGCTFIGWSKDKNATSAAYMAGQTGVKFDGDITLYAVWKTNEYTIFLDMNDGSGKDYKSLKKTHGTNINLPTTKPGRTNYQFLGWSESSTATTATYATNAIFTKDQSIRLYAVWKRIEYTITFDENGGNRETPFSPYQVFYAGDSVTLLDNCFTREFYSFEGWATDKDATEATYAEGETVKLDKSQTLYAVWKRIEYSIFYDGNGGNVVTGEHIPTTSQYFYAGNSISILSNCYVRQHYRFVGWAETRTATEAKYQPGDGPFFFNENITLYAVWKRIELTITYEGNGGIWPTGEYVPKPSQSFYSGDSVTIGENLFSRDGYQFKGWAKKANADKVDYVPGDVVTLDYSFKLYAVWETIPYELVFDGNGGRWTPWEDTYETEYHKGDTIVLSNAFTRSNYVLKGWAFDKNAEEPIFGPTEVNCFFTGDKTLYAVWAKKFSIVYHYDGRKEKEEYVCGNTISLESDLVGEEFSRLIGWALCEYNKNDEGVVITDQVDAEFIAKYDIEDIVNVNDAVMFDKNQQYVFGVDEKVGTREIRILNQTGVQAGCVNASIADVDTYTEYHLYPVWNDTKVIFINDNKNFEFLGSYKKEMTIPASQAYLPIVLSDIEAIRFSASPLCGWTTTPDSSKPEYLAGESYTCQKNVEVFYAIYGLEDYYRIDYFVGDQLFASQVKEDKENDHVMVGPNGFDSYNDGKTFLGWRVESEGFILPTGTMRRDFGDLAKKNNGVIKLTATWLEDNCYILAYHDKEKVAYDMAEVGSQVTILGDIFRLEEEYEGVFWKTTTDRPNPNEWYIFGEKEVFSAKEGETIDLYSMVDSYYINFWTIMYNVEGGMPLDTPVPIYCVHRYNFSSEGMDTSLWEKYLNHKDEMTKFPTCNLYTMKDSLFGKNETGIDEVGFALGNLGKNEIALDISWIPSCKNNEKYRIGGAKARFIGWATDRNNPKVIYQPGDTIPLQELGRVNDFFALWAPIEDYYFTDSKPRMWLGLDDDGKSFSGVFYLPANIVGTGSIEAAISGKNYSADTSWKFKCRDSFAATIFEVGESRKTGRANSYSVASAIWNITTAAFSTKFYSAFDGTEMEEVLLGKTLFDDLEGMAANFSEILGNGNNASPDDVYRCFLQSGIYKDNPEALYYLGLDMLATLSTNNPDIADQTRNELLKNGIQRVSGVVYGEKPIRVEVKYGKYVRITEWDTSSKWFECPSNCEIGSWLDIKDFNDVINSFVVQHEGYFQVDQTNHSPDTSDSLHRYIWVGTDEDGNDCIKVYLPKKYIGTDSLAKAIEEYPGISCDEAWIKRSASSVVSIAYDIYEAKETPFDWTVIVRNVLDIGNTFVGEMAAENPLVGFISTVVCEVAKVAADEVFVAINYDNIEKIVDEFQSLGIHRSAGIVSLPMALAIEIKGDGSIRFSGYQEGVAFSEPRNANTGTWYLDEEPSQAFINSHKSDYVVDEEMTEEKYQEFLKKLLFEME